MTLQELVLSNDLGDRIFLLKHLTKILPPDHIQKLCAHAAANKQQVQQVQRAQKAREASLTKYELLQKQR